ncbi:MAG: hypothetical protein LKJ76_09890 [Lachnospiraceae bacterium]|jgi:membrane-associated HD superfamily phosphohydrolase|nr:hypothetical protein [Lachnospiraceae bacterium]
MDSRQSFVEKYGLKDWRNAAAAALSVIGLIYFLFILFPYKGDDALGVVRTLTSLVFFIAALVFTTICYKNKSMMPVRILILLRIILTVFNYISCFVYNGSANSWWIIAYLTALLIGLIVFFAVLSKPGIATPVIIAIIILSIIYAFHNFFSGDQFWEAFSPTIFEYFIIALIYSDRLKTH